MHGQEHRDEQRRQSAAGIGWRHLRRRPIGRTSADSLDALIRAQASTAWSRHTASLPRAWTAWTAGDLLSRCAEGAEHCIAAQSDGRLRDTNVHPALASSGASTDSIPPVYPEGMTLGRGDHWVGAGSDAAGRRVLLWRWGASAGLMSVARRRQHCGMASRPGLCENHTHGRGRRSHSR